MNIADVDHGLMAPANAIERRRKVIVERVWDEADEVRCLNLKDLTGAEFPELSPGAHVDVHLQEGIVRQYSICNGPDQRHSITIAVKCEPSSRGGSLAIHRLKEGDLIEVTGPRNNFPLDESARHHLLIAGGIGITPLLSMARFLKDRGADFTLAYFARSPSQAAFRDLLNEEFREEAEFVYSAVPEEVQSRLDELLAVRPEGGHVYCCGPRGFMNAVVERASLCFPHETVHLEYFSADEGALSRPQESFRVRLARSGKEIDVPAGTSIVDALARHGVHVDMMCQQGVCGTCMTRLLDGVPDHRDSFLSPEEKHANDRIMICCSRSRSPVLVLDL